MRKFLLLVVCTCLAVERMSAEVWSVRDPRPWSRCAQAIDLKAGEGTAFSVRHTGNLDWCVYGFPDLSVRAGDAFRLSCTSKALPDGVDSKAYSLSVILRDAKGEVMKWTYATRTASPGLPVVTEFLVPPGGASLTARVVGTGPCAVEISDLRLESLGNRLPKSEAVPARIELETPALRVCVRAEGAAFEVTDRRTGRVWAPEGPSACLVTGLERRGDAIGVVFVDAERGREWTATIQPDATRPEVVVTVDGGRDEMWGALDYPLPFATRRGERLIVPMNEGIGYPVDEPDSIPTPLSTASGHGVCMAFFGVQDDATGAGHMGIIETADDAAVASVRRVPDGLYGVGPRWLDEKGRLGYARRVRYVFFESGGHVAMCKRYRAYAKETGKLKTFSEKAKARPNVLRLLGAPNIWCWEKDRLGMVSNLVAAGIDRFLWSAGGSPEEVRAIAAMPQALVSRYDVYRDIYHPEQIRKLGWKSGTNMDAWPEGAAWNSPNSNDWRKAWGVKAPDGTWTYCACMCDAVSAKFCRWHVTADLRAHPYNTRFVDVTTAAEWDICFNPAHPMTRGDSRRYRMDLLRLLGEEFGLVVGSETGHDAAVPFCDYFEGMLSLCHYRVPDSGRNIEKIWTEVPPAVMKYQVGEAYRLPLWELVYHDCLCAHWYWGDYNNKLPSLWEKRDLFNVLYGTMGMFVFNGRKWQADRERFVRSYRITSPVARRTGMSEMLSHRILSADRTVQRTEFADGTVVTVNFGSAPARLPEGGTLAARGHQVTFQSTKDK